MNKTIWMIALLFVCGVIADTHAEKQVDPRLKEFAKQKRQQTEEMAAKLHLNVPRETRNFFKAAEAGDWAAVSNRFARIRPRVGQYEGTTLDPAFANVLWIPVQETDSAYALFAYWGRSLLKKYADGILSSIPSGSIYFGGTDPGRFGITMFRDVAKSPDIFIITQNGLADGRYTDYLRLTYGERLSLPSSNDVQAVFQQYANELKTRAPLPDEQVTVDKNGRVTVRGVGGVMAVNAILTKWIFDHNKDKHEFYVEESYFIPWMYPYMEPHGLILKLKGKPMKELDPAVVTQDRQFWDALAKELLSDPHFLDTQEARKMFAKLRSAIGGLYAYRHLTTEAEAVYKQSQELCATSPEANFRLAQLYMEARRFDEAITVLEQLESRLISANADDRQRQIVAQTIEQLREAKRQADKKQSEANAPSESK